MTADVEPTGQPFSPFDLGAVRVYWNEQNADHLAANRGWRCCSGCTFADQFGSALIAAIDRVLAVEVSRLGASARVEDLVAAGDSPEVAFYAGASFALARVRQALRGEA